MPSDPRERPDLLAARARRPPLWLKALYVTGALVCFALGVIGWLIPVVTGVPFYVAGIILLALASDRIRRLINRLERRLPDEWRGRLRRALDHVSRRWSGRRSDDA